MHWGILGQLTMGSLQKIIVENSRKKWQNSSFISFSFFCLHCALFRVTACVTSGRYNPHSCTCPSRTECWENGICCTFLHGLDDTSKEALKVRLCCVVRMVRGLLGRLLSCSSALAVLSAAPADSSSSSSFSSSSSSSSPSPGGTDENESCEQIFDAR